MNLKDFADFLSLSRSLGAGYRTAFTGARGNLCVCAWMCACPPPPRPRTLSSTKLPRSLQAVCVLPHLVLAAALRLERMARVVRLLALIDMLLSMSHLFVAVWPAAMAVGMSYCGYAGAILMVHLTWFT